MFRKMIFENNPFSLLLEMDFTLGSGVRKTGDTRQFNLTCDYECYIHIDLTEGLLEEF